MIEHAGIHTRVTPVIDLSIGATRYVVALLFWGGGGFPALYLLSLKSYKLRRNL
jgi:hypothetical protein